MSRFGDDPRAFFDFVYQDTPPWDIGAAQPAMSALLTEYPPQDPILDVGCGSGDLAIHLAQLGHQVTGIDFVESAIAQAQEKMKSLPAPVARLLDFRVADALKPSLLQQPFGAVVDSGFFHLFSPDECDRYMDELALTLIPGGRYYLHAFDIEFSMPNLPRKVSIDEVRTRFTIGKGWNILELRSSEFHSRVAPPVPATIACIEWQAQSSDPAK
jgi:ubiquinone/menaquinone biosynthesis C-methylase UbiE